MDYGEMGWNLMQASQNMVLLGALQGKQKYILTVSAVFGGG